MARLIRGRTFPPPKSVLLSASLISTASLRLHSTQFRKSRYYNISVFAAVITGAGAASSDAEATPISELKASPLIASPDRSDNTTRGFWNRVWRLVSYLGWDTAVIVLAAAFAVAASVLGVVGPVAVGQLWEAFASSTTVGLSMPAAKLVTVYVARVLLQWISSALVGSAVENAAGRLRESMFSALLELDMAYFDSRSSATVVAPLSEDVKELRDTLRLTLLDGLPAIIRAVGGVISMFMISPGLAAALLAAVPPAAYTASLYASHLRDLSSRSHDAQTRASVLALEGIGNIRTVRACTAEGAQRNQYHEAISEYSRLNKQLGREISLFNGAISLGMSALAGIVILCGGHMVQSGVISRGDVAAFLAQTFQLESSTAAITVVAGKFMRAQSAVERISSVLQEEPIQNGGLKVPSWKGDVEFQDVHFSYPNRPAAPVLTGLSMSIPAGSVVAIAGPSGSGKSTIASLILGFYSPSEIADRRGTIRIDGVPLDVVDKLWLRQSIGFVPQDPVLFDTTIRGNIAMGNPTATDEDIVACAQTAQAFEFIQKLPLGFDTHVGERGTGLSGGQKQRIALARALLRNPKLLVLDEYTSALDTQSEAAVQRALAAAMRGRTVFIIAHRLSTIQAADKIIVIKDGAVAEAGSHTELLLNEGLYAELVHQQNNGKLSDSTDIDAVIGALTVSSSSHSPRHSSSLQSEAS